LYDLLHRVIIVGHNLSDFKSRDRLRYVYWHRLLLWRWYTADVKTAVILRGYAAFKRNVKNIWNKILWQVVYY